jgi:hypothetical protein
MPQLSSTERLIMASKDMTDALQHPHPEVPFAQIRDDTISALAELAALFKTHITTNSNSDASGDTSEGHSMSVPH